MLHAREGKTGWLVLLVPLVAVIVIGHLFVFYRLSSHLGCVLATALILLLVLTHSGVFAAIDAFFKRRGRG
jgi:hypothetical protein